MKQPRDRSLRRWPSSHRSPSIEPCGFRFVCKTKWTLDGFHRVEPALFIVDKPVNSTNFAAQRDSPNRLTRAVASWLWNDGDAPSSSSRRCFLDIFLSLSISLYMYIHIYLCRSDLHFRGYLLCQTCSARGGKPRWTTPGKFLYRELPRQSSFDELPLLFACSWD